MATDSLHMGLASTWMPLKDSLGLFPLAFVSIHFIYECVYPILFLLPVSLCTLLFRDFTEVFWDLYLLSVPSTILHKSIPCLFFKSFSALNKFYLLQIQIHMKLLSKLLSKLLFLKRALINHLEVKKIQEIND